MTWLSTLTFRSSRLKARRLLAFARAELASHYDLQLAAAQCPDPVRAAQYLRHAQDESRHAAQFLRRANELLAGDSSSERTGVIASELYVDYESLFVRLGEVHFLAFVHQGELLGCQQFRRYVAFFKARSEVRDAEIFGSILSDELRHAEYSRALLSELSGQHAARALRNVRFWKAWRSFRRVGSAMTQPIFTGSMLALYLLCGPVLGLVRVVRRARPGWTSPEDTSTVGR